MDDIEAKIDQDFIDALNRVRKERASWDHGSKLMVPVLQKFKELGADPRYSGGDWVHVSLSGDAHAIADGVRILRTAGWKTDSAKPTRNSPQWSAFFSHENVIGMSIYFSFSSSVCRRVKVGTETKTVDVYEVQCGESDVYGASNGDNPAYSGGDVPF